MKPGRQASDLRKVRVLVNPKSGTGASFGSFLDLFEKHWGGDRTIAPPPFSPPLGSGSAAERSSGNGFRVRPLGARCLCPCRRDSCRLQPAPQLPQRSESMTRLEESVSFQCSCMGFRRLMTTSDHRMLSTPYTPPTPKGHGDLSETDTIQSNQLGCGFGASRAHAATKRIGRDFEGQA